MKHNRDHYQLALMILPYMLGICLLFILPACMLFILGFYEYDFLSPAKFIGFQNMYALFHDEIFHIALRNSLQFVVIAVPLRLIAALSLALLLHNRFYGVGLYRVAACVPTIIPDIAYALVWLWIFNPVYGPFNLLLTALGFAPIPWFISAGATQAAVILMSVFQIGEGFLVALATRQAIPKELYEQLALEKAGTFAQLRWLTLPLMTPILLLLAFRDVIFSLQATFVPALVMTGGGPPLYATTYLPLYIYDLAFDQFRYGYASAATLIFFVITGLIIWVQYLIIKRLRWMPNV